MANNRPSRHRTLRHSITPTVGLACVFALSGAVPSSADVGFGLELGKREPGDSAAIPTQATAPFPKTIIRAIAYLLANIDEHNIGRETDTIIGSADKTIVVYSLPTDSCIFQARTTVPPYRIRQLNMRTIGDGYHDDGRTITAFGEIGTYCDKEFEANRSSEFPLRLDTSTCGVFRFSPSSNYERDMKKRIIAAMAKECPRSPRH